MIAPPISGLALPIGDLTPDPANARIHPPRSIEAIAHSLNRFGQRTPIVAQRNKAGALVVRKGNGTLEAARSLGWAEIACIIVEEDDVNATAYSIADNRTSDMSEFDDEALGLQLEALAAEGFEIEELGFDPKELEEFGIGPDDDVDDPGPEPPPEKPVSRPGDLWLLDDHRLLCGDSTKPEDLNRLMAGEKASLLATDPPYYVDYTGMDRPVHDGRPSGKDWSHVYREVDIEDLGQFLDGVLTAVLPHVVDDAAVYMWHAHLKQPVIAAAFEKHGLLLHQILVWVKPVGVFSASWYHWQHECCAFGWRRGLKPRHPSEVLTTVWSFDYDGADKKASDYPTQKPTRLFEIPMEVHTKPHAIVLEPFSGSGSQIIAAEKLRRRCRALEIQPAFVDVAIRRFEKATGKVATLDGSGETFAAAAAEREV